MQPQVSDAFGEWFTGLMIGAIPLFAHLCAYVTMEPAASNHVVGGWAMDVLFIGITLTSTSLVNLVRKAPEQALRGRAVPVLTAVVIVFLVLASILYAGVVTGHARGNPLNLAIGLAIGAGFVSIYLELGLAARIAGEPAKSVDASG